MKNDGNVVTISIPESIYEKIRDKLDDTEFNTVEAYVNFVLNEVLYEDEQSFNSDEESEVGARLKDLGYID